MSHPVPESRPRVSAIVAVYNEARHIGVCLKSLREQTYPALEILVVDDGSRDGTASLAEAVPGVRVLRRAHEGKARAVNAAALAASGDILLFLDGDLRFDREYVSRLVEPILAGTDVGSSHATEFVANPDNVWSRCLQVRAGLAPDRRMNLTPQQIAEGTVIFRAMRRDLFLSVGGFDSTGYLDDNTLYPKVGRRGRFVAAAICYHHNPDRLREVFAAGTWAGKSVHHLYGARAALTYFPPLALVRAARVAVQTRMAAMVAFATTYETGVFWGILKRATRLDQTLGA